MMYPAVQITYGNKEKAKPKSIFNFKNGISVISRYQTKRNLPKSLMPKPHVIRPSKKEKGYM